MSKKNILLSITNGLWLIDTQSAEQLGENVAAILAGKNFWDVDHKSKAEFLIVETSGNNAGGSYFAGSLNSAKPNSVAVINISGPIMKEDNCGDPGTKTYTEMLAQAQASPNITGVVLVVDSPGGTVAGTQAFADQIKAFNKPVVTLAEDLMASAAYWIGSSADYVYLQSGTTRVGSIGTMISFADMQPAWEAQGIKFHEIYATDSTQKNKDFADARKGNYDAIKKNTLDPLNNEFVAAVKENRGNKLNAATTLNGQVYVGQAAINNGLADAFGTLQDAVNKVAELAASAPNKPQTNQNQNMKKITLTASHAALLALFGASIAAGTDSVEVELTDEKLTALEAALSAGTTAATDLATAKKDLETATTAKTKAETELTKIKKANPGATTTVTTSVDDLGANNEDDFSCELDEQVAANRKALGLDK